MMDITFSTLALLSLCMKPRMETKLAAMYEYLKQLTSISDLKRLLHAQNKEGFRPVEFACKETMYELFWVMFNTHGVHLARHENRGGTDYRWYRHHRI